MYGGTLLDSLCLVKEGISIDIEFKKIISMVSFSRNAFLVTDSDAIYSENGDIKDQSRFKAAKEFMAKEFERLNSEGLNLGIWFKKDNTEIRTLENYLDDKTTKKNPKKGKPTKKIYAQRVSVEWADDKSLKEFKCNLFDEIRILHETIQLWNK